MVRALLITMLLIPTAAAQILPGPGGSLLPPRVPGAGLPLPLPLQQQILPSLTQSLNGRVRRLEEARKLKIRALLHRYPRLIEADPDGNPIVRDEVLALAPSDAALARAGSAGFAVVRVRALAGLGIRLVILRTPAGTSTRRALDLLRRLDPSGTYDFDHIYIESGGVIATPLDPQLQRGTGKGVGPHGALPSERAVLGLIDGGVDVQQPLFQGAVIHQHGCSGAEVPSAHGTAVASLMIGRSAQFSGAAPGARLYAADVYCGRPTGGAVDAIAAALAWMVEEGVSVINVSLVGPPNALLQKLIDRVLSAGSLVVAAVGNDGPAAPPLYPAAYPGVIGVTAVDAKHRVLFEAERGPQVMFAAPGADIEAARVPQGLAAVRGTSFAAPLVAGLLARRLQHPDPRSAQRAVTDLIHRAIHLGPARRNSIYGYGLVAAHLPAHSPQAAAAPD
jgi:Subtilase family